jgi:hypothetical protein
VKRVLARHVVTIACVDETGAEGTGPGVEMRFFKNRFSRKWFVVMSL